MASFQKVLRLNCSIISNCRSQCVSRLSTSVLTYSPKQTIEEKLGFEPRPKRPPTPFLKFMMQLRPTVLQENPNAKSQDIVKLISEQWKTADPELKENLQSQFIKEKEKYLEELKHYEERLSPNERDELAKAKKHIKTAKENRALKKKKEDLGRPKRPLPPFIAFFSSKLPDRGTIPYDEFRRKVSAEWEALSDTDRERHHNIYKQNLELYKDNLIIWEDKMKEQGFGYLVSSPTPKMGKPKDTPKRPGGPYSFYQKFRQTQRGEMPNQEFQKLIAEEWKNMSENEKEKFEQMSKKAFEDYNLKMEAWTKAKREIKSKANAGVRNE